MCLHIFFYIKCQSATSQRLVESVWCSVNIIVYKRWKWVYYTTADFQLKVQLGNVSPAGALLRYFKGLWLRVNDGFFSSSFSFYRLRLIQSHYRYVKVKHWGDKRSLISDPKVLKDGSAGIDSKWCCCGIWIAEWYFSPLLLCIVFLFSSRTTKKGQHWFLRKKLLENQEVQWYPRLSILSIQS